MASSKDHGSLVVSSNLTSTMKTLFKEKRISSCQEPDKSLSLGPQRLWKNFGVGTYNPIRRPKIPLFKGGESVIRLSLGRRLVNLLPVAQRTNAFTYTVFVATWFGLMSSDRGRCTVGCCIVIRTHGGPQNCISPVYSLTFTNHIWFWLLCSLVILF